MSCSTESQGTTEAADKESTAAADQKSEELKPAAKCELDDSSNSASGPGERKEEQPEETGKEKGGTAARQQQQPPFLLKDEGSSDYQLQSMEQDADDEAADDTDDTSSVTSSASSTASSQSGSGTSRKKSIPLSIKNLKRKHKKKKTKISREFKPGDRLVGFPNPGILAKISLIKVLRCKLPPQLGWMMVRLVLVTNSNYLVMTVQWPVWNQVGLSPACDETGATWHDTDAISSQLPLRASTESVLR